MQQPCNCKQINDIKDNNIDRITAIHDLLQQRKKFVESNNDLYKVCIDVIDNILNELVPNYSPEECYDCK